MSDYISRQDAIDLVRDVCDAIMSGCNSYYDPETDDEVYKDILEVDAILKCNKEIRIALRNMPSAEPKKQASDEIYGMMKDYYFKHRNDHDDSWQGGFAKCMNLIPNTYERRTDG